MKQPLRLPTTVVATLAACILVSNAAAQPTPETPKRAQLSVVVPPDLAWLEGLHIETGTIIRTRDGHVLKHAVRVFAVKETMSARPAGIEGDAAREELTVRTVSVLAEPSLASVFLRKRLLSGNEAFDDLTIFSFRGAGGPYRITLKNARVKSVGTTSFQGRVVDEYVFHGFDDIVWRYETTGDPKERETIGTGVRDGIAY